MEKVRENGNGSLLGELSAWNKVESLIQHKVFMNQDITKDTDFLKMKMNEYDRLWYKYKGDNLGTTDEKALLTMIRFQQKKMRKTLYPGLIPRLFHRIKVRLKVGLNALREARNLKHEQLDYYTSGKIELKDQQQYKAEQNALRPEDKRNYVTHRYGPDLGKRQSRAKNHRQGRSL